MSINTLLSSLPNPLCKHYRISAVVLTCVISPPVLRNYFYKNTLLMKILQVLVAGILVTR